MPTLPDSLFTPLQTAVVNARQAAENAAGAALKALAVEEERPLSALDENQRRLRVALRARLRQLGSRQLLIEEIAYEQWHRMLFARFLAENNLLMHPGGVNVSLAECDELTADEGEDDAWRLAARYAAAMLPGIFRPSDPCAQVRLAPEGHRALETLLQNIPALVFKTDDALGWMYQFWQAQKKEEVNNSERKIGGADISPVTQLFTEDYMVRFLLENSLGAWWAARHPESPLIRKWEYLRWMDPGEQGEIRTPAAGSFPGWPERAADVTMLDPCCGSGHILVRGFHMLRQIRMEEEDLGAAQAADAVLRDNLFGLELDQRCTQIAAFALALEAWKVGNGQRQCYRPLPALNISCSGIPVQGQLETWQKLAGDDNRLRTGLERLYGLFKNAPDLGSLINPADLPIADRMFIADYEQVAPILDQALARERNVDPVAEIFGAAAEGVTRAARLLAKKYTLVLTNVPYLGRGKQSNSLMEFCEDGYPDSKTDLATVFVERIRSYATSGGSYGLVTPQMWLFLSTYKAMRVRFLKQQTWNFIAKVGPNAFLTISGEVVNIALLLLTNSVPNTELARPIIDVQNTNSIPKKIIGLLQNNLTYVSQAEQLKNPDSRVTAEKPSALPLLDKYANAYIGLHVGDWGRHRRMFWEVLSFGNEWRTIQNATSESTNYSGYDTIIYWPENGRMHRENPNARVQGISAWGKKGVIISMMDKLPATMYLGGLFRNGLAAVIAKDDKYLPAIWAFCSSPEFNIAIRKIDQKLYVTSGTLVKIPFDLERWQKIADQAGPIPEPYSDDPTQWLFKGPPNGSTEPLQVAAARLLGYKWPQQTPSALNEWQDEDGIVCLPSVHGEQPAAERLRGLLAAAYDTEWSVHRQDELLAEVGFSGRQLADWLLDGFFEQHCRLFQNRPFIWHIWDGRKDGFSALVNYHKLDTANLEKLIYTYLGDWLRDRQSEMQRGLAGAEGRYLAAKQLQEKLIAIRIGEKDNDIYVRWKPLHQQALGWDPDLNDGVRLNIRPFVTAGVLRSKFTINWNKDRGKNVDDSERLNDLHLSLAEKRLARQKAGV
jgi:hypothetical protein